MPSSFRFSWPIAAACCLSASALLAQAAPAIEVHRPATLPQTQAQQAATILWKSPPPALLPFSVRGQLKGLSYQASAQLSWQPSAGRYEAAQEVRLPLVGTRRQSSVGQLTPQGLQPEVFIDAGRKEDSVSFDAGQGQIRFSRNQRTAPWAQGTQDRLSVFFQVAGMLAAAPRDYPSGTAITFSAASKSSLKPWTFIVRETESLTLPAGTVTALKLQHLSGPAPAPGESDADGLESALWLAPQWGYLPVRIRLQEGPKDSVDLLLKTAPAQPSTTQP